MSTMNQSFLRPHQAKLEVFYRLSDIVLIGVTLVGASYAYGIEISDQYLLLMVMAMVVFALAAEAQTLYRSFRGARCVDALGPLMTAWGITVFGLLALAYAFKATADYSRVVIGTWVIVTPLVLIGWRMTARTLLSRLRAKGYNTRRAAIVGAEEIGISLADVIEHNPSFGLKLVGFFDDRLKGDRLSGRIDRKRIKGSIEDVVWLAKRKQIDLVYIALSMKGQDRALKLISELADSSVAVHLVPDWVVYDMLYFRFINVGAIPTVSVYESPYFGTNGVIKRIEDIIFSSVILTLIAVPMLLIAMGVKLSSPGPVIFKQRRYGVDGREIRVWKFRSMTTCDDGKDVKQAQKDDARVTPFGAVLRKTSLDELPQFINVLKGDMSIVGPRPHAVAHNEQYRRIIDGYMLRHKVKPGITGWAQVNGFRGETDTTEKMKKRVEYDIEYIRRWSLWFDVAIIVKTVFTGFVDKRAY